MVNSKRTST